MELTARARRRAQDVVIGLRERVSGADDLRQQQANMRRQRMTCSESLRAFSQTQDWTGGMSMSPSGRFQVIEEARPKQKIFSREGIRIDMVRILLIAVFVIGAAILLFDLAAIGNTSRAAGRLERKIEAITAQNEAIRQELAQQAEDISVCTDAVRLNLVSGYGVQNIQLTIPQHSAAQGTPGGRISASAGD